MSKFKKSEACTISEASIIKDEGESIRYETSSHMWRTLMTECEKFHSQMQARNEQLAFNVNSSLIFSIILNRLKSLLFSYNK